MIKLPVFMVKQVIDSINSIEKQADELVHKAQQQALLTIKKASQAGEDRLIKIKQDKAAGLKNSQQNLDNSAKEKDSSSQQALKATFANLEKQAAANKENVFKSIVSILEEHIK